MHITIKVGLISLLSFIPYINNSIFVRINNKGIQVRY